MEQTPSGHPIADLTEYPRDTEISVTVPVRPGADTSTASQVNTSLFVHETEQDAEVPDSEEETDTDVEESVSDLDKKKINIVITIAVKRLRQQTIAVVIIQRLILNMILIVKAI